MQTLFVYLFINQTFQFPVCSKYDCFIHPSQNPFIFCLLENYFIELCSRLTCEPYLNFISPCLFTLMAWSESTSAIAVMLLLKTFIVSNQ